MPSFFFRRSWLAMLLFAALSSASARADNFSALYVFGDSLSDAGNAYILSGGALPGATYSNGRFSNGNVWVQDMAGTLGLPAAAKPSLQGGTDYAIGGATSGSGALNLGGELTAYGATHSVGDPNALYMIWIGANDLRTILGSNVSSSTATNEALGVVTNIDNAILALKASGAKNFMIVTVPDLGKTPEALATGPANAAVASGLTQFFDASLVSSLPAVDGGLNLKVLDTYSLIDGITANPGAFGFSDVTDPCLAGSVDYSGGTPCANPNSYLFWDTIHPTAAGHAIVAADALALVPEPATLTMMLGAVGAFGVVWAKKRRSDLVN
jgi:phospholipase/lecithinase/hemolysin